MAKFTYEIMTARERKEMLKREAARLKKKCVECERVFDLGDDEDADEWYYGHDCEATDTR